jgi:NAD(P)H-dependent flavin oxidoreductase YrpB (nitropropane dioxygenase family)
MKGTLNPITARKRSGRSSAACHATGAPNHGQRSPPSHASGVPGVVAGGIADGRGIATAFALGAAGTQIGTAYLLCPEAATPQLHRDVLRRARADATLLTNVFAGRPARV